MPEWVLPPGRKLLLHRAMAVCDPVAAEVAESEAAAQLFAVGRLSLSGAESANSSMVMVTATESVTLKELGTATPMETARETARASGRSAVALARRHHRKVRDRAPAG